MATEEWRVGVSSYTYPWAVGVSGRPPPRPLTVEDLLDRAVELRASVVQVADNLPLHRRTAAELAELRDRAHADGLTIEVGTRGITADILTRDLAVAVSVGSPLLRVVVDHVGHEPAPAEIVALLRPHEQAFRRAGVTLAIENHDRLTSATLAGIVHQLGEDWVGICLDTVNSLGALEGPEVVITTLGPLTVNLHLKDFDVVRSNAGLGFDVRGRPVGQGRLDVARLLRTVGRPGLQKTAVVELWTPEQATLADTVALENSWARQSVEFLLGQLRRIAAGGALDPPRPRSDS